MSCIRPLLSLMTRPGYEPVLVHGGCALGPKLRVTLASLFISCKLSYCNSLVPFLCPLLESWWTSKVLPLTFSFPTIHLQSDIFEMQIYPLFCLCKAGARIRILFATA